jgi:hypothetical protein
MFKNRIMKIVLVFAVVAIIAVATVPKTSALISQNLTSWYWTSDTQISATATADVNGDGQTEIVTVGSFNDGSRYNAQVVVWNATDFTAEKTASWYWTGDTGISSLAIGDVNGDGQLDIVTGGSYFDGTRYNAQLCVFNGATLALENVKGWYWTSDTQIASVAVANVSKTTGLDIVTGGSYFDGTHYNAQLCTWSGATLVLENVKGWLWTSDTYINSVATGDFAGSGSISIVTAGIYNDGTRNNAQLVTWDASTLSATGITSWYWTSDTNINSVAVANVLGGASLSIVAGGDYNDGVRINAQLTMWDATTLVLQGVNSWYVTSDTKINCVAVGNYSGSSSLDIITAGSYKTSQVNAQLKDFNGASFNINSQTSWFTTSDTQATAVAIGNFGAGNRVVTGSSYFDNFRSVAQIITWG